MGHFIWGPTQTILARAFPTVLTPCSFKNLPTNPETAFGAMALDTNAAELATKAKVPAKVLEWLVTNDILT